MSRLFTDQSAYFHISNFRRNYNPVEFANEAFLFHHELWENYYIRVQAGIPIFDCVVEFIHLFIFFYKPSFCNGPETELKCKIVIRQLYYSYFIIYRYLVLSPF
jgi:hypothetical protein